MRTRDDIEGGYNRVKKNDLEPTMLQVISQNLMLEVLLDIRELLQKPLSIEFTGPGPSL